MIVWLGLTMRLHKFTILRLNGYLDFATDCQLSNCLSKRVGLMLLINIRRSISSWPTRASSERMAMAKIK